MKKYISVLLHVLELLAVLAILWLATVLFPDMLPSEATRTTLLLVLAGAAKFVRVSPDIPAKDWVNDI